MVAVRMIEQQRPSALKVMTDLIDSFLTIAEPEIARQPATAHGPSVAICWQKTARGEGAQRPSRALRNGQPKWALISAVDRPGGARGGRAGVPHASRPLTR